MLPKHPDEGEVWIGLKKQMLAASGGIADTRVSFSEMSDGVSSLSTRMGR